MRIATALTLIFASLLATPSARPASPVEAAIAHPDRPGEDRARDRTRRPELILPFARLEPGGVVVELGAGGGYTTELAARVVGTEGHVYAQALDSDRVRGDRLPNVTALPPHLLWELGDKLGQAGLAPNRADVALIFFALHDIYLNERIDKRRLYDTLMGILKPGGYLVILDNTARGGSGIEDTPSLHRIDPRFVIQEVEDAGFTLDATSDALRNGDDDLSRPWNASTVPAGEQDRFALRFRKPG